VSPGKYTARLKVGDQEQSASFEVKPDPRSSASTADYDAQERFLLAAGDKLSETHKGIKTIRDIRDQMTAITKRLSGDDAKEIRDAADALSKKLTAVEEALYQTKAKSNQDVLNFPIRLNNRLAALAGTVGAGDNRPTDAAVQLNRELTEQIDAELSRLRKALSDDLPKFNDLLRSKKVPGVFVDTSEKKTQPAKPGPKEPALRDELVARMKAEQDARFEFLRVAPPNKAMTPADRGKPDVKAALERMEKVDKENLAWLKVVVEKHGWPSKSMVGQDGAQGAFLIAQHAVSDLEFMTKCLTGLKTAYQSGDADGQWVALMTDRLLVLKEKKKQLYGTQIVPKDGKLVPEPIEDEANVDARRKALGMSPLAEYLKQVNDPKTFQAPKAAPAGKR
jgi:hypothetical protein